MTFPVPSQTPPPDLPSLLLESRIVYLGMPLVSAVTELIVAELLYLQYRCAWLPPAGPRPWNPVPSRFILTLVPGYFD